MKKLTQNINAVIIIVIAATLLIAGCYEFNFVIQPNTADPNSSFEVQLSVNTTEGDSTKYYLSYFSVKLPVGWNANDSISYTDSIQSGYFLYSDSLTQVMNTENPPNENYIWLVFQSSDSVLYSNDDIFYFDPVINTDDQTGNFSIDYHLGDNDNGVYGEYTTGSTDHIITVGLPEHVYVANTNDHGPGSLRDAIDSVAHGGKISFNLEKNETIVLEEQIEINKDVIIEGPQNDNITVSGNNSCRVFSINENHKLSISNISIENGNVNGDGGGILVQETAELIAENVKISNNSSNDYGGGIYCNDNSKLRLYNVTILNNTSYYGGGISALYSDVIIENTFIQENIAGENGGGIYAHYSDIIIGNTILQDNHAYEHGGGIRLYRCSSCQLNSISIIENKANNCGGGISVLYSDVVIENIIIQDNEASQLGGGIYCLNSDPILSNAVFENNKSYSGGGVYCSGSNPEFTNTLFIRNKSGHAGGAIYGGNGSNLKFTNVTMTLNTAGWGGGGIGCRNGVVLAMTNSIMFGNTHDEISFYLYDDPCTADVSYSNIWGGEGGIITNDNGTVNWLEGNIDEIPLFVYSGDHPYQINDYSPCINAGTPDTTGLNLPEYDLAGEVRFVNNRVDMGAYEWNLMVNMDEPLFADELNDISVYPNPIKNQATIDFIKQQEDNALFELYNTAGTILKTWNIENKNSGRQKLSIVISDLPPGIYFLRLQVSNDVLTKKIVKL